MSENCGAVWIDVLRFCIATKFIKCTSSMDDIVACKDL